MPLASLFAQIREASRELVFFSKQMDRILHRSSPNASSTGFESALHQPTNEFRIIQQTVLEASMFRYRVS